MKKLLAVLLMLCMLTALLAGCGHTEPVAGENETPSVTEKETSSMTDLDAESVTTPETQPDTRPDSLSATVPETLPETVPETLPETDTETVAESEAETGTQPETEAETTPETEPAYETDASGNKLAGTDSGIVRDGTPKKYFTIRMDDGITQDARLMEILRKYGTDCCTFYANSGLLGVSWAWVGQQFGRPDIPHQRYTRKDLQNGIYDGFDVGVHTQTHPSLKNLSDAEVTQEVEGDRRTLTRLLGYTPVGMAWPGGDTEWNEHNIDTILATTNIRFGSCTTRTGTFALPTYFMQWYPTCSFSDGDVMTLAQRFIDAEPTEDMLFYVWCHGYELDLYNTWDKFDELIKMITEAAAEDDSIVLVTNSEFYQLFKDEIPSWKE